MTQPNTAQGGALALPDSFAAFDPDLLVMVPARPVGQLSLLDTPAPVERADPDKELWRAWSAARLAIAKRDFLDARHHYLWACCDEERDNGLRALCEAANEEAKSAFDALIRTPARTIGEHRSYKRNPCLYPHGMAWFRKHHHENARLLDEELARLTAEKNARQAARKRGA